MPDDNSSLNNKVRDLEEKLRLLKDRTIIIGKSFIEERDKNFKDIQEMKKALILIKEENIRIKELLERVTEQISNIARKEEVMIIQRQLDLLRK
jgi:hypothetical protein